MPEKIIGILGGMGPEATIDLFYKIIKLTPVEKDQDHLRIIIDNNPKIPDRTAAILGKGEDPLPALQKTAKNLEKAGADFIIIPCNTAHYFLSSIQESVKIPILDMIKETAQETQKKVPHIKKVGLLATTAIYQSKLYHQAFKDFQIEVIIPNAQEQQEVMKVIRNIKAGNLSEEVKKSILKIAQKLIKRGVKAVITGCTEIPLILKEGDVSVPIIEPTQIVARIAVKKAR